MLKRDDQDSSRGREVPGEDIFGVLERDHRAVRALFDQIKSEMDDETEVARGLFAECRRELLAHAHAEDSVLYPVLEEIEDLTDFVNEAREEHALVDKLIDEVLLLRRVDDEWQAKLNVLSELVQHHVEQEERDAFPKARQVVSPARASDMAVRFLQAKTRELGPDDDNPPDGGAWPSAPR